MEYALYLGQTWNAKRRHDAVYAMRLVVDERETQLPDS
jgi:hypothetical protein